MSNVRQIPSPDHNFVAGYTDATFHIQRTIDQWPLITFRLPARISCVRWIMELQLKAVLIVYENQKSEEVAIFDSVSSAIRSS